MSLTSHSGQDALEVILHVPESQAGLAHGATSQEDQLEHVGLVWGSPRRGDPTRLSHAL